MPSRERRARGEQDYLLTLKPDVKAELERLADQASVPLSVALREGAREWLLDRQAQSMCSVCLGYGATEGCPQCGTYRDLPRPETPSPMTSQS